MALFRSKTITTLLGFRSSDVSFCPLIWQKRTREVDQFKQFHNSGSISLFFISYLRKQLFFISSHVQVRFEYAFQTVAGFIIPYAIIITSYVLILKRLRETRFQRNFRSEKLILAIVIMFGLFWLPYHVVNMIRVCKGIFSTNNPITTSNLFVNRLSEHSIEYWV